MTTELKAPEKIKPKLDERFIKNIQGKDFVLYSGLLDLAHQKGLQKLEVELIQIPNEENQRIAVCRAIAVSHDGKIFSDIGDAESNNVNKKIAPHIIRMASTRAKARALRDFCNIGMTCLEELGEISDVSLENEIPNGNPPSNNRMNGNGNGNGNKNGDRSFSNGKPSNSSSKMSEAQHRAIANLAKRRNISPEALTQMILNTFQSTLKNLSLQQASQLIQTLQNYS